jgi:hypothetical protein
MTVEGALVSDFEVVKGSTVEDVYRNDVAEVFGVVRTVADVVVTLRKGVSRRGIIGSLSFEVYVLERLASACHKSVSATIYSAPHLPFELDPALLPASRDAVQQANRTLTNQPIACSRDLKRMTRGKQSRVTTTRRRQHGRYPGTMKQTTKRRHISIESRASCPRPTSFVWLHFVRAELG